jgi:predicted ATP-dependent Lon-type protease
MVKAHCCWLLVYLNLNSVLLVLELFNAGILVSKTLKISFFCCSNALFKCFERSENASVIGSLAGATGSLVERACSGELAISSSAMKKNVFEYTANQMSAAERKKLFTGVRETLE